MIMKKGASLVLVMWSFLLLSATSKPQEPKSCQAPEGEFVIYGELQNVPDGSVLELLRPDGKVMFRIASDTVIDGKFFFKDTITCSKARKLNLSARSQGFPGTFVNIWVKSGACVRIAGKDCLFPLWKIDSDVPEQQVESEFSKLVLNDRRQMLKYLTERSDLIAAHPNMDFDQSDH